MIQDFNTFIDRSNTHSLKWSPASLIESFGTEDVLPLWIADMDFKSPQVVIDALIKRAEHGIFGYSDKEDSYYQAVVDWQQRRNDWQIKKEWIVFTPGVVPAIVHTIQMVCQPGDKVIIQNPVYYPFRESIENNNCEVVSNQLKYENGRYFMNYQDLEKKARDPKAKIMILCSPHNPVGRVWTEEELIRVGEICIRNEVLIIVDEIHSDLILKGHCHIPFAKISEPFAQNSITCTSPSKTFNLAGLKMSNIIVPNNEIRELFQKELEKNAIWLPNSFGIVALETAYTHGEPWLEEIMNYIQGNIQLITTFLKERLPEIKLIEPEGTYLVWLDFTALDMDPEQLNRWIIEKARLALDDGVIFGEGGEGFQRVNVACTRDMIQESMERFETAIKEC